MKLISHPFYKIGQRTYSPARDKIKCPVHLFRPDLFSFNIFQTQAVYYLVDHLNFFSDGIDKVETCSRKHNCQRNTRKSATGTGIHYFGKIFELNNFGNRQRMQNMMEVKIIKVLSGDDIDPLIPVGVNFFQFYKLVFLLLVDFREIVENYFAVHKNVVEVAKLEKYIMQKLTKWDRLFHLLLIKTFRDCFYNEIKSQGSKPAPCTPHPETIRD